MLTFATHLNKCPDGGIGRRAGLKHQWIHFHAGSIPALGTEIKAKQLNSQLLSFFCLNYPRLFGMIHDPRYPLNFRFFAICLEF